MRMHPTETPSRAAPDPRPPRALGQAPPPAAATQVPGPLSEAVLEPAVFRAGRRQTAGVPALVGSTPHLREAKD